MLQLPEGKNNSGKVVQLVFVEPNFARVQVSPRPVLVVDVSASLPSLNSCLCLLNRLFKFHIYSVVIILIIL